MLPPGVSPSKQLLTLLDLRRLGNSTGDSPPPQLLSVSVKEPCLHKNRHSAHLCECGFFKFKFNYYVKEIDHIHKMYTYGKTHITSIKIVHSETQ
jgi:hypothetical protein